MKSKMLLVTIFVLTHAGVVFAANLSPVSPDDWSLKIVTFDVGQADAALLLTPDGDAALIDTGAIGDHGTAIADYLLDPDQNGVGEIPVVKFLFTTHFHSDHAGGIPGLRDRIRVFRAYDQGPTDYYKVGTTSTFYGRYVRYLGDPNGNCRRDSGETGYVRRKARPGTRLSLGHAGEVEITVLSVNGNTYGTMHDLPLSPFNKYSKDPNDGSMILLVTLGDFEFLTTGDAGSDDWDGGDDDTEEALIDAGAIEGGPDIDVLKVAHHGSDTSSGRRFVESTRPEVALISSDLTGDRLPKCTALKIMESCGATVLVTGRTTDEAGDYHDSKHEFDDGYTPESTYDRQGMITILVAPDGSRYTVTNQAGEFSQTWSSKDPEE